MIPSPGRSLHGHIQVVLPRTANEADAAVAEVLVRETGSVGRFGRAGEGARIEIAIGHAREHRAVRCRIAGCALCSHLAAKQTVHRARIVVKDAEWNARLDHGNTGKLPVRKHTPRERREGGKLRRRPGKAGNESLVPVSPRRAVGRMPEIVLVVGRQLQFKEICADLSIDFVQVLRPRITRRSWRLCVIAW